MVTASHVSDKESGFKLVNKNGLPFDQGEILALKNSIAGFLKAPIVIPKSEPVPFNNFSVYIDALQKALPEQHFSSRIIVDFTNSTVEPVVRELFKRLKIDYEAVASENSGNPLLEENRRQLAKAVQNKKADLGIIWDSDGDRVAFVDGCGELIPMTFVLGLLAAEEVAKHRGSTAVADVRAGLVVRDLVAQSGGKLEVTPAWSQFFKFAMAENKNIVFGGETSGHFVFRDFNCVDDGVYAALKFLYLWENRGAKEKLPLLNKRYFELPERNFSCPAKKAPLVLEKLSEYFRQKGYDISIKDGLSVFGPDFKFNLRSSLTESYLRLNLEAKSEKNAGAIVTEIERQLERSNV
jgi:phosphomannomutase